MKKIRLTMKLLLFFSLALVLNTSAIPSKAQQTKVSLNLKDKQLTEVLKLIQQQSGFNILYSNELVKNNRMVSLRIDSDDIHEVMRACLQGNALDYEIQNNTIIIKALAAAPQVPQVVKVRGHVIDAKTGQPMPGVTVVAMDGGGAVTGAATDADGLFTVNLPEDIRELTFTFVGYKSVTLPVQTDKEMTVRLEEEVAEMDEVVVNGYFTKSKNSYTGAVKTITNDQLKSVSNTNIIAAISALTPGLNLVERSDLGSNPNRVPELLLRGMSSFLTSSLQKPLFYNYLINRIL